MDIILEKKKGLRKKHLPYVAGGSLILILILWMILGNHRSRLTVEHDKLMVDVVTRGEFNDYIRINGQVEPINTIQLSAIEGVMVEQKVVKKAVRYIRARSLSG